MGSRERRPTPAIIETFAFFCKKILSCATSHADSQQQAETLCVNTRPEVGQSRLQHLHLFVRADHRCKRGRHPRVLPPQQGFQMYLQGRVVEGHPGAPRVCVDPSGRRVSRRRRRHRLQELIQRHGCVPLPRLLAAEEFRPAPHHPAPRLPPSAPCRWASISGPFP